MTFWIVAVVVILCIHRMRARHMIDLRVLCDVSARVQTKISGRQTAFQLLAKKRIRTVRVPIGPFSFTAFDSYRNRIMLSYECDYKTILAVASAAHEVGHAVRFATRPWGLKWRSRLMDYQQYFVFVCFVLQGWLVGGKMIGNDVGYWFYAPMGVLFGLQLTITSLTLWEEFWASRIGYKLLSNQRSWFTEGILKFEALWVRYPNNKIFYSFEDLGFVAKLYRVWWLNYFIAHTTDWMRVFEYPGEVLGRTVVWLNWRIRQRLGKRSAGQLASLCASFVSTLENDLTKQSCSELQQTPKNT